MLYNQYGDLSKDTRQWKGINCGEEAGESWHGEAGNRYFGKHNEEIRWICVVNGEIVRTTCPTYSLMVVFRSHLLWLMSGQREIGIFGTGWMLDRKFEG